MYILYKYLTCLTIGLSIEAFLEKYKYPVKFEEDRQTWALRMRAVPALWYAYYRHLHFHNKLDIDANLLLGDGLDQYIAFYQEAGGIYTYVFAHL